MASQQDIDNDVTDSWRYNLDTYAQRVSGGWWQPYEWNVYLAEKLAQAVLSGNKRIIITAPPRHGKSELTSRWLSTWYLDQRPNMRVILASYSAKLAVDWSKKVRDAFDGSNPDVWAELDPNTAASDDWRLREGGGMRAVGVGGSITGFGGDLILIDDPHKDWAEVQSPTQRQKVIDWFNGTLYHRMEPNATIILIQTRWNEGDLAGYLLSEHEDDWIEIRMPAIAEEGDALGRQPGEALCPERYPTKALKKIKRAVGSQVFAGLFQQRPAPAEGNIIKREWINYYGGPTGIELPEDLEQAQSWDLNFGEVTKNGSHVVGQVWGDSGGNAYMLDQVRGRWEYTEIKHRFRSLTKQWPEARAKYIEKKAAGAPLISDLRDSVKGLIPILPKGSKEARLQSVAPLFESGDVWLPHPSIAGWVPDLVERLVAFPNAESDDEVDTLSQYLERVKPGSVSAMDLNLDLGFGAPSWRIN